MSLSQHSKIQLWGRANSVNVQKVLWCLSELDLEFEGIDAGMQYGRTDDPSYREMNPNGRVPTLVDGDFVLWESNSIVRYLTLQYGVTSRLYPSEPKLRSSIDRWLDWVLSTLQVAERPVFWGLVRTPPAERDMAALQEATDAVGELWRIVDSHLSDRTYLEGNEFSVADIVLGAYARRWFGVEGTRKPALAELQRWYTNLTHRPAFQRHVAPPLS